MYSRLLQTHPVITKCITSGVIMSLGDILTQKFVEKKQDVDWRRNINLFAVGTFYLGPSLHLWYSKGMPQIINRVAGPNASKFKASFTGMLFDQILFAPIFLSGFFIVHGVIGQGSLEGVSKGVSLCQNKLWEALLTNWKIWPIATMINLTYVPMQYRVLFANFIGLFWNMYLSYVSYK